MTIDHTQLRALMADVTTVTTNKILTELGLIQPFISMHKACKIYGKDVVERWIDEGLIKKNRDAEGKMWRLDRNELEIVSRSSNRHSFLNNQ